MRLDLLVEGQLAQLVVDCRRQIKVCRMAAAHTAKPTEAVAATAQSARALSTLPRSSSQGRASAISTSSGVRPGMPWLPSGVLLPGWRNRSPARF